MRIARAACLIEPVRAIASSNSILPGPIEQPGPRSTRNRTYCIAISAILSPSKHPANRCRFATAFAQEAPRGRQIDSRQRQETCRVVRYGVRLGELQGSEAGHTGTEAAASLSVIAVGTRIAATGLSGGSGGLKECS